MCPSKTKTYEVLGFQPNCTNINDVGTSNWTACFLNGIFLSGAKIKLFAETSVYYKRTFQNVTIENHVVTLRPPLKIY